MRCIIVARVSTEEQMREGQSIPAQLARAREYVKRNNLVIKSEYQFNESSLKDQRTKFEEVIKEIKNSKEKVALVVETIDRLQRSFKESVLLDELRKQDRIEIHFIRENLVIRKDSNSSELLRWDMGVMMARNYVMQITDNVKRTLDRKAKNGEIVRRAPIGYLNTTDDKNHKTVIIDPDRGELVKQIFELYSTGNYSMQGISDYMDAEGLRSKTPERNKLNVRQIEHILKNPFYYGEQIYDGKLYPHIYKPLVTRELFDICTIVRTRRNRNVKINSKPYILKGLMKCKRCGCTMTPEIHKGRYIYYSCTNHKKICKRILVPEKDILEPIKKVFREISLPQKELDEIVNTLRNNEEAKNKFYQNKIDRLRKNADKMNTYSKIMYTDRLNGVLTADEYEEKVRYYAEEQKKINAEVDILVEANESYYVTASKILSIAQRAGEIFESSEIDEKRQIINFIFQNLEMEGKTLDYELKTPFKTIFLYNKKTPSEKKASSWGA